MEQQKRLTPDRVDKELELLENRRENGNEENTDLYNLKKETLSTFKKVATESERAWERIKKINNHSSEQKKCKKSWMRI